jgi:hypothetical protein
LPGCDPCVPSLKTFHSLLSVPWNHTHPSDVTKGVDEVVLLLITFWLVPSVFIRQSLLSVPRK